MSKKLETNVYSQDGKTISMVALPEMVFGIAWNQNLVHEVILSMQSNARAGTAHTKDRSEVRGGGKKPWKQKGTGRARHGSSRSPIWAGGGVAHGPRTEKDYTRKINKNTRAKALACVLSQKFANDSLLLVDSLIFGAPQTKDARAFLNALGTIDGKQDISTKRKNAVLIVIPDRDTNTELSFRNFGNVEVVQVKDLNPVALLTYKYVVVAKPDISLPALQNRVASKAVRSGLKAVMGTTVNA